MFSSFSIGAPNRTYENVEVKAGPYLNLIIGPNGTGKSAIVCAIIIGLGGDPSVTGRASTFADYIRFGCTVAVVQIELFNKHGPNFMIERKLISQKKGTKTETKSEWKLNEKAVKLDELRKFVSSLNISVDNLCQFLPQERVVEFVKMNARELLVNTEKAAGQQQMHLDHQELINLTKEIKEDEKEIGHLSQQLETHKGVHARLETQVKIVQEKKKFEEEIGWLEKKKPWLEYEAARQEFLDAKRQIDKKEKELNAIRNKDEPLRKFVDDQKQTLTKQLQELKAISFRGKDDMLRMLNEKFGKLMDVRNNFYNRFNSRMKMREQSINKIEKLKNELNLLEIQFEQLKSLEDPAEQVKEMDGKIAELRELANQLDNNKFAKNEEKSRLEHQRQYVREQMHRLSEVQKMQYERLQQLNPRALKAYQFYRENKSRYRKTIYLPYLVINVKDPTWLAHVEDAIPHQDLFSFIAEDQEDLKRFSDDLLRECNIRINCILAPNVRLDDILQDRSLDDQFLQRFNFKASIIDLFTCPETVKVYFCKQYFLHLVPVGDDHALVQDVLRTNCGLRRFYVGMTRVEIRVSRFDSKAIVSKDGISKARKLIVINEQQLKECQSKQTEINIKMAELDKEIDELLKESSVNESELSSLKSERKRLVDSVKEKTLVTRRIKVKKEEIEACESELIDVEKEKETAISGLQKVNLEQAEAIRKYYETIEDSYKSNSEKMLKMVAVNCTRRVIGLAETRLEDADRMNKNLVEELVVLKETQVRKKREAQQKINLAHQKTGTDPNKALPTLIKKKFEELPNSVDEIDQKYRTLVLKMNSMETDNDNVLMQRYGENVNLIKHTEQQLEELVASIEIKTRNRTGIKERWLTPLNQLIECINVNFSKFMVRLNYEGMIKLSRGENEDNFEEYGISIMVRYRKNEVLKELSATHQSGGERSVATMVYMIALQELTKVPFRCVDEINQGMDDTNERNVFDLIVETASKSSSQYFLLTPKLLQDLNFSDKMQIHVVFNGPTLELDWENHGLYENEA